MGQVRMAKAIMRGTTRVWNTSRATPAAAGDLNRPDDDGDMLQQLMLVRSLPPLLCTCGQ